MFNYGEAVFDGKEAIFDDREAMLKSLCGGGGGFQFIAWSQPQSGLAVTILAALHLKHQVYQSRAVPLKKGDDTEG